MRGGYEIKMLLEACEDNVLNEEAAFLPMPNIQLIVTVAVSKTLTGSCLQITFSIKAAAAAVVVFQYHDLCWFMVKIYI